MSGLVLVCGGAGRRDGPCVAGAGLLRSGGPVSAGHRGALACCSRLIECVPPAAASTGLQPERDGEGRPAGLLAALAAQHLPHR